MAGFHHLDEFYAVNSSCNYINQVSDQFRSAEEHAFFSPCESIGHFRVAVNLFMKARLSLYEDQSNAGMAYSEKLYIRMFACNEIELSNVGQNSLCHEIKKMYTFFLS